MMTTTEQRKRLRRNNILLAIVLGIIALMGAMIPFYYLNGLNVAG